MLRSLFGPRRAPVSQPTPDPAIPDGQRVYAVGDIHGRADLLDRMADLIERDLAQSEPCDALTIFLGDYVDRGLESSSVIERLAEGRFPTPIVTLLGNHEDTLLDFLQDEEVLSTWRTYGGMETLFSYGVAVDRTAMQDAAEIRRALDEKMPRRHREFLGALATHHVVGDYYFCHAGVRPGVPLDDQQREDLIWIREPFLSATDDFGKFVVHGHTPAEEPVLRSNRVGVDTGAYATGRLTCARLEGTRIDFVEARR